MRTKGRSIARSKHEMLGWAHVVEKLWLLVASDRAYAARSGHARQCGRAARVAPAWCARTFSVRDGRLVFSAADNDREPSEVSRANRGHLRSNRAVSQVCAMMLTARGDERSQRAAAIDIRRALMDGRSQNVQNSPSAKKALCWIASERAQSATRGCSSSTHIARFATI